MFGSQTVTPQQALAAVATLMASGSYTRPQAVTAVILQLDEASVDAVIAEFGR